MSATTAVPTPTAAAASASAASESTTSTTASAPGTSAPDTSVPPPTTTAAVAEDAVEPRTELDFRIDPDGPDDEEPTEWVVGENVLPGLWQWSQHAAANCIFLVVAPTNGSPGPRSYGVPVNWYRFLDGREPIALLASEVIIGYSAIDDISDIIGGTSHPSCFLEWIAENERPESETFFERYGELDKDDIADWSEESSSWECRAHTGPEPVDRLDWKHRSGTPHPEVSCKVGVGILPGWWQWSGYSAPDCIYVVVNTGGELSQTWHSGQDRRDARSPILLSEGEIVQGYSDSDEELDGFIAATSHPTCFLEHTAPENQPSA